MGLSPPVSRFDSRSNSGFDPQHLDRIQRFRQQIPPSVRLIAVTKTVAIEQMRLAYAAGIRDFGESRIQEALEKQAQLQDLSDLTWHFIGPLQQNKARKAMEHFDWIHSVHSLKLAKRLDQIAAESISNASTPDSSSIRIPKLCLQVKLRPDPNKQGWTLPDLWQDLPELERCSRLQICGLMVIPPLDLNPTETRQVFEDAQQLLQQIQAQIQQQSWTHLQMQELSMGMSEDYPLALAAGATMIRLGRVLFGDRSPSAISP